MTRATSVRVAVRLTPRAESNRIDGIADGKLRVRVTAPPVAGGANEALLRLLARALDLPRGSVRLVRGERGRDKLVELDGPDPAAIRDRWPGLDV